MDELTKKHCVPCEGGEPAISDEREDEMLKLVQHDKGEWLLMRVENHKLRRQFIFKNFKEAMVFVNAVADIAEEEGHHPDIAIFYNKVQIDLYTHAVGGLSENDFIMAAKIDVVLGK